MNSYQHNVPDVLSNLQSIYSLNKNGQDCRNIRRTDNFANITTAAALLRKNFTKGSRKNKYFFSGTATKRGGGRLAPKKK